MAVGEKRSVVMGAEKAAPNGVATLGADGKLVEDQRPDATGMGAADRTLSNLTAPQTALYNLGAGVRPNLLINTNFDGAGSHIKRGFLPINQHGAGSYTGNRYTVDGWVGVTDTTTVTLGTSGLSLNIGGAIVQKLPEETLVSGETYTFSALFLGTIISSSFVFDPSVQYQVIVDELANGYRLAWSGLYRYVQIFNVSGAVGSLILAAKLERGIGQTLAMKNEDGTVKKIEQPDDDYGNQLLRCQRYFQIYSTAEARPDAAVNCRPEMRTPDGGVLTQGTLQFGGVTYYYNSSEL